jgi:cytoskeletal protein CcmA (bactofilin family)
MRCHAAAIAARLQPPAIAVVRPSDIINLLFDSGVYHSRGQTINEEFFMAETNAEYSTTIGPDASFNGHLKFEKGVRLLGKFEGEITSKGQLEIAEGAKMSGQVSAGTIRVDGEVKGNLTAETKVLLSASGRLEGDIQASRLEVAEGAVLVGQCMVGSNGKDRPATAPKSATPDQATLARPRGGSVTPEPAKK